MTATWDVLDRLVALARTVAADSEQVPPDPVSGALQVIDGPAGEEWLSVREVLAVGVDVSDEESASTATADRPQGLSTRNQAETVVVRCVLSLVWGDDVEMAALRVRARQVLDALTRALRADPRLGGAARYAWLGPQVTITQRRGFIDDDGTVGLNVDVRFDVTAHAMG